MSTATWIMNNPRAWHALGVALSLGLSLWVSLYQPKHQPTTPGKALDLTIAFAAKAPAKAAKPGTASTKPVAETKPKKAPGKASPNKSATKAHQPMLAKAGKVTLEPVASIAATAPAKSWLTPSAKPAMPAPTLTAAEQLRLQDNEEGPLMLDGTTWLEAHPFRMREDRPQPEDVTTTEDGKQQGIQAYEVWLAGQSETSRKLFTDQLQNGIWLALEVDHDGFVKRFVNLAPVPKDKNLDAYILIRQLEHQQFTFNPPIPEGETAWIRVMVNFSITP